MKKATLIILVLLLVISVSLNFFLFSEYSKYQDGWVNQIITTSEIEALLKNSGVDTSFESIFNIAKSQYGESVKVVTAPESMKSWGADSEAIGVNDSILMFKDGKYWGSKSNLR